MRGTRRCRNTMRIEAEWMRGGTSKCWVFETEHLDETRTSLDELLPRLFGSPDSRQIDGVGGATSTTSKAMILRRPVRGGCRRRVHIRPGRHRRGSGGLGQQLRELLRGCGTLRDRKGLGGPPRRRHPDRHPEHEHRSDHRPARGHSRRGSAHRSGCADARGCVSRLPRRARLSRSSGQRLLEICCPPVPQPTR